MLPTMRISLIIISTAAFSISSIPNKVSGIAGGGGGLLQTPEYINARKNSHPGTQDLQDKREKSIISGKLQMDAYSKSSSKKLNSLSAATKSFLYLITSLLL